MILKLKERYSYDETILKKDLKTYLIEFVDIEYYEIDLLREVLELKNDEKFMQIWREEGSKEHCKYNYCLSLRPDIPDFGLLDINDCETAIWLTDEKRMPCKVIFIKLSNVKNSKWMLLDKRRWDIEIVNDVNVRVDEF